MTNKKGGEEQREITKGNITKKEFHEILKKASQPIKKSDKEKS